MSHSGVKECFNFVCVPQRVIDAVRNELLAAILNSVAGVTMLSWLVFGKKIPAGIIKCDVMPGVNHSLVLAYTWKLPEGYMRLVSPLPRRSYRQILQKGKNGKVLGIPAV